MIKNNKEYRLEDRLVDDEWDFYCEGNCINRIGCDFLREVDACGSRCYCMECARKMFLAKNSRLWKRKHQSDI